MGEKKIGLGLIGCGNIGQIHSASFARLAENGVPIRAVIASDPLEEHRRAISDNWRFEILSPDAGDVITHPEVDAVFLCTPTFTHRDLILSILSANKHLYSEKPLAPDFETVKEICQEVAKNPVIAQVGFQMRHNAMHASVKRMVERAEYGRPVGYLYRDDECWPTTEFSCFASDWRSQGKLSGGGPLIEHSIHGIDLLAWLFGPPVRVSAATRSVFGYDVEDVACLVIEHESGVIGTLLSVYGGVEAREESRFEVFFEKATVEITWGVLVESEENHFRITRSGESPEDIPFEMILRERLSELGLKFKPFFWNELASLDFFNSIQKAKPACPGFGDALIAHAVVEAAYRSASEKRMVELKELLPAELAKALSINCALSQ